MKIGNYSTFLQGSFWKYQWREALLLCLIGLIEEFTHQSIEEIMKQMKQIMNVKKETQEPKILP